MKILFPAIAIFTFASPRTLPEPSIYVVNPTHYAHLESAMSKCEGQTCVLIARYLQESNAQYTAPNKLSSSTK